MERLSAIAFTACLGLSGLYAQTSDIVVFSDMGEKFTLIIDGEVKNDAPASRVVATGIRTSSPMLVVNFADAGIPSIKQGGWMEPGQEYTLRITTNKKGVRVLRPQGQAPLGTAAAAPAPADKPAPAGFTDDVPADNGSASAQATTVTAPGVQSSTTVTTTTGNVGQNVNVNMGVNGFNVAMTVNDGTGGTATMTTTTTTTTGYPEPATPVNEEQAAQPAEAVAAEAPGCSTPMTATEFADAKASIESKGFDETKLTLAKQIGNSNCFSAAQVKAIMDVFGFEETKLDFAKFAYGHTTDVNNYYKVNDAFGFSSSIDELNKYIQGR